jgi:hypothetical protein
MEYTYDSITALFEQMEELSNACVEHVGKYKDYYGYAASYVTFIEDIGSDTIYLQGEEYSRCGNDTHHLSLKISEFLNPPEILQTLANKAKAEAEAKAKKAISDKARNVRLAKERDEQALIDARALLHKHGEL